MTRLELTPLGEPILEIRTKPALDRFWLTPSTQEFGGIVVVLTDEKTRDQFTVTETRIGFGCTCGDFVPGTPGDFCIHTAAVSEYRAALVKLGFGRALNATL